MTEEKLDFLDERQEADETEDAQPVEAETEAEPEPEAEVKGEKEEVEPPSATEEVEPTGTDQRSIPVTALLDEREKRQLAQNEVKEERQKREQLERKMAELEQRLRPQQPPPDFYEDPDKAIQYHNQQLQQQHVGQTLKMSKFLAEREFGPELVAEAYQYFDQHPQESQALLNEPSPFHAAVEHYKRQKFLTEVKDPDAWREQERERIRQEILAEAAPVSKPNAPPPSMVKATAAGKDAIPQGGAFDSLFSD